MSVPASAQSEEEKIAQLFKRVENLPSRSPLTLPLSQSDPSKVSQPLPLWSCGLFTDIQYADLEDRPNYGLTEIRFYRNSLNVVQQAVKDFQKDPHISFILHLGDIIDGQNAFRDPTGQASKKALETVINKLLPTHSTPNPVNPNNNNSLGNKSETPSTNESKKSLRIYHMLGNHELYNYPRSFWNEYFGLSELHLNSLPPNFSFPPLSLSSSLSPSLEVPLSLPSPSPSPSGRLRHFSKMFPEVHSDQTHGHRSYYCLMPHPKWRILVMDSYDISMMGWSAEHPHHKKAALLLDKLNPNEVKESPTNLQGINRRFVKFNGGIGQEQISWLEAYLHDSDEKEIRVIICTHVPFYPTCDDSVATMWNYEEMISIVESHPCVVACLHGHDHDGFVKSVNGIHHQVFEGLLLTPPGRACHGRMDAFDDRLVIHGVDLLSSANIKLRPWPKKP